MGTIFTICNSALAAEDQVMRIACYQTIDGGGATVTGFVIFEQDNTDVYQGSELLVENEMNLPETEYVAFNARLFQTVKMPSNITQENALEYSDSLLDSSKPFTDIPSKGARSYDSYIFHEADKEILEGKEMFTIHPDKSGGVLLRNVNGSIDSRTLRCFKPFLVKKSPAPTSAPVLADGSDYDTTS